MPDYALAREEAWEGKDPRGIRVLLNNPRWERRLLRFLELSGVGRVVEAPLMSASIQCIYGADQISFYLIDPPWRVGLHG